MSLLCLDDGAGRCSNCRRRLPPRLIRNCFGKNPQKTKAAVVGVCPHLLDPTDESVLLFGCGCSSDKKNGVATSVFECDLYGRCAPLARGTHLSDESVKMCAKCESNPATAPLPILVSDLQSGKTNPDQSGTTPAG